MTKTHFRSFVATLVLTACLVGCGGSKETILPTDPLSAEQIEAIKQEDDAIADDEMGGGGTYVAPAKKK